MLIDLIVGCVIISTWQHFGNKKDGVKPSFDVRNKMKAVKYRWNPNKMIWWAYKSDETIAVAKEICGDDPTAPAVSVESLVPVARTTKKYVRKTPKTDYALRVKIKDIVNADKAQLETWEKMLKDYVNAVMSEGNSEHSGNSVSKSQESVWMNCFKFIAKSTKITGETVMPLCVWTMQRELRKKRTVTK